VTLGTTDDLGAAEARSRARAVLKDAATDGLPGREQTQVIPTFEEFAPRFWRDYADHWKPLTQRGNRGIIKRHLVPTLGAKRLDEIVKTDVLRWRDDMASKPCTFKNALPVLGVMLTYAEQLGFRPEGSNPCRGVPRFRRGTKERYLTANEFRRLAAVLVAAETECPTDVALIRLLLLTGARTSEIVSLRWSYVEDVRLRLPDSKTGPKYLYLNRQARAVLDALPRGEGDAFIFPTARNGGPYRQLGLRWAELRSRAAIPDVCLHDLRHTFASVAINDNVPLATIGRLLGHELPETTARYAHLMDESVAEAAKRVCGGIARDMGLSL
jgi:integrase